MPPRAVQVRIQLYTTQAAFRHSDALYRGFVGGRGSGKTYVGAYDLLRRAEPGRLYGAYAPTYPMLRDAALRTFLNLAQELRFLQQFNKSDMVATLGNGAEVLFRSLDEPERARGPNLSGAWMDEASLVDEVAWHIVIACLREAGEQGFVSATFTPKGRDHWTYRVFGVQRPNTELFHATTRDNPFLPAGFYDALREQYTDTYAAQELGGEFIDVAGGLAQRAWFDEVLLAPGRMRRVRAWDLAATERKVAGDDPDYTVGTLLATDGRAFYVEDVIRERLSPGAVEDLIYSTAERDGHGVTIRLEQEPGSSGKLLTAALIRGLAGYVVEGIPSTGDKVSRAMPLLAQAEAGNVKIVRGAWNRDWLGEMVAFPVGVHDDQVDSAALAFDGLVHARLPLPQVQVQFRRQ